MRIPYANRTADVELPVVEGQPKVTVKLIIDSFRGHFPSNFIELFEAFVLMSPKRVRVTFKSPRALEDVQHSGLDFRGQPVIVRPCRTAKWVNVTRLSYGIPDEALKTALGPYGRIFTVKTDTYQGVYTGVRHVLMEITTPIPSSLKIAEHWCNVFYPGQVPTCFSCRRTGHTRANCPGNVETVLAVGAAVEAAPVLLSPARHDLVAEFVGSVVDQVSQGAATFAEVLGAGLGGQQETHTHILNEDQSLETNGGGQDVGSKANRDDSGAGGDVQGLQTDGTGQVSGPKANCDDPFVSETVQGLEAGGAGLATGPKTNGTDPASNEKARVASDSHNNNVQGLKVESDDRGAGLETNVDVTDLMTANKYADTTSESDSSDLFASDDEEQYEDAQEVMDSLQLKRVFSSDSSDSSESTFKRERKRGKVVQAQLNDMFSRAEDRLARASCTPLPDGDDDDDLTQDPNLNTPKDPEHVDDQLSLATDIDSTDYPLTQLTPLSKVAPSASQPTDLLSSCLRTSTRPTPVVGTRRVLRSSQTQDKPTN